MNSEYKEYVIYVDDHRFSYTIWKNYIPETNSEWYDFLYDNITDEEQRLLLLNSKHIKVYTILPSIGDSLLITEFDTDDVLDENDNKENDREDKLLIEQHNEEGVKYDDGKPLVGTMLNVFPYALMEIGRVIEFGTHKYPSPTNWRLVEDGQKRYQDALMRHLLKHNQGKEIDEETGRSHLAHVAWNALAILELYLRQNGGQKE